MITPRLYEKVGLLLMLTAIANLILNSEQSLGSQIVFVSAAALYLYSNNQEVKGGKTK